MTPHRSPFLRSCRRRDALKLSLLKYRNWQGFLVSGQHSGTQWVKYMLGVAVAHRLGVEPPRHASNSDSNDLIGHPRARRRYHDGPRIASSHSIPNPLLASPRLAGMMRFPPYVLLVRDMRAALVSNFEKWRQRYAVDFATYLRGDPTERRYIMDIWWYIRFLNAWSRVRASPAQRIHLIRYEEIQDDPAAALERIFGHWSLDMPAAAIEAAVAAGSKEAMAARLSGGASTHFLRRDPRDPREWFDPEDRRWFTATIAENLIDDFGYDLSWDAPIGSVRS